MANKNQKLGKYFSKEIDGNNYCEVSISHRKAGYNAWHGNHEDSGIEVCVMPVKRKNEGGFISTSFMLFQNDGFRILVAPMERFSQKKFDIIVNQVENALDDIVNLMEQEQKQEAVKYVQTNIGLDKDKTKKVA